MRAEDSKFKRYFQTTRYFRVNQSWFFQTREGEEVGPFESKEIAEYECQQYIYLQGLNLVILHDSEKNEVKMQGNQSNTDLWTF